MSKIAIITGGGRGIGRATAIAAAGAGYDVAISYLGRAEAAEATIDAVRAAGRRGLAVQADSASEPDLVRYFETVDRELGRVDALVNNAGIIGRASRVDAVSADDVAQVMAVNVVGCFVAAREAVKRMSTRRGGKGGAIVNVSSAASRLGSPGEFVHYAASKGALDTFTLGLAKEVAEEGIRVNAVRPGLIETEIHAAAGMGGRLEKILPIVPMQRLGAPEEVAAAILWLLSDAASYVTGSFVEVSGGR